MKKQRLGDNSYLFLGLGLLICLALPPVARLMESTMVGHMLIQIPLLVMGGCLLGFYVKKKLSSTVFDVNKGGYTGMIIVVFVAAFWILPRSLDGALNSPLMEMAKFISLPLLVGIPLALSWGLLHPIAKSFIWANLISMLGVMSWLYLNAPVRLCNNYLLNQQVIVGQVMFMLTIFLLLAGFVRLFFGSTSYRVSVEA